MQLIVSHQRVMLRHSSRAFLVSRKRLWPSSTCASSFSTTTPHSQTGMETPKFATPLELLHAATKMAKESSERLVSIAGKIDQPFSIPNFSKEVTLKDIVLHSRDASPEAFHQDVAVEARAQVLVVAEEIESELKGFGEHFTIQLKPVMDSAAMMCKELDCGGASLDVEKIQKAMEQQGDESGLLNLEKEITPCEKFTNATLDFLQTTYETKEQVALGSRSALILRLAQEFNDPLATVRNDNDNEGAKKMSQVFAEQVVPTPWVKSNEEYQEFFKIREQIEDAKKESKE